MRRPVLLTLGLLVSTWSCAAGAELCFAPSSYGYSRTLDCDGEWNSHQTVGYRTDGEPCGYPQPSWCGVHPEVGYFLWTLSSSSSDPTQVIGEEPTHLYLWYYCQPYSAPGSTERRQLQAAEFSLVGDIEILSFTLVNGFLNAGTSTNLLLAVGGCPDPPTLAGVFEVRVPTSVDESSWGRIKGDFH